MKKLIISGGILLLMAAVGCQKKGTLEDQLKDKPDTTAQQPDAYVPEQRADSAALREEQFRRESDAAIRPIYFGYNLYELTEEARNTLAEIGRLMSKYDNVKITIDGHCDERGSAEYNMALGQKRADQAKEYLVSYGVSSSRITTNSWGEERPAVDVHDESGWSKNRRAEFTVQR